MEHKSQETITILPPSNEHLETGLQNRLDLWLNTQKSIAKVIYKLLEHVSPKVGFCKDKERKLQTNIFMKTLANQIQQYVKRSIHHDMGFCLRNSRFT